MRAHAALLALTLAVITGGCGGTAQTPSPSSSSNATVPAAPNGAPGPAFSGTYVVVARNLGTEGEDSFTATWRAIPSCGRGVCDTALTISRPGFTSYPVVAEARDADGPAWRWAPVLQTVCPDSGAPFRLEKGGYEMRPERTKVIGGVTVALILRGSVEVRVGADGCSDQHLLFDVTASRTGP